MHVSFGVPVYRSSPKIGGVGLRVWVASRRPPRQQRGGYGYCARLGRDPTTLSIPPTPKALTSQTCSYTCCDSQKNTHLNLFFSPIFLMRSLLRKRQCGWLVMCTRANSIHVLLFLVYALCVSLSHSHVYTQCEGG